MSNWYVEASSAERLRVVIDELVACGWQVSNGGATITYVNKGLAGFVNPRGEFIISASLSTSARYIEYYGAGLSEATVEQDLRGAVTEADARAITQAFHRAVVREIEKQGGVL